MCCLGTLDTPCRFAPNANEWIGSRCNRGYGQENTLEQWRAINESRVLPKVGADKTHLSVYTNLCSDVLSHYLVTTLKHWRAINQSNVLLKVGADKAHLQSARISATLKHWRAINEPRVLLQVGADKLLPFNLHESLFRCSIKQSCFHTEYYHK